MVLCAIYIYNKLFVYYWCIYIYILYICIYIVCSLYTVEGSLRACVFTHAFRLWFGGLFGLWPLASFPCSLPLQLLWTTREQTLTTAKVAARLCCTMTRHSAHGCSTPIGNVVLQVAGGAQLMGGWGGGDSWELLMGWGLESLGATSREVSSQEPPKESPTPPPPRSSESSPRSGESATPDCHSATNALRDQVPASLYQH